MARPTRCKAVFSSLQAGFPYASTTLEAPILSACAPTPSLSHLMEPRNDHGPESQIKQIGSMDKHGGNAGPEEPP